MIKNVKKLLTVCLTGGVLATSVVTTTTIYKQNAKDESSAPPAIEETTGVPASELPFETEEESEEGSLNGSYNQLPKPSGAVKEKLDETEKNMGKFCDEFEIQCASKIIDRIYPIQIETLTIELSGKTFPYTAYVEYRMISDNCCRMFVKDQKDKEAAMLAIDRQLPGIEITEDPEGEETGAFYVTCPEITSSKFKLYYSILKSNKDRYSAKLQLEMGKALPQIVQLGGKRDQLSAIYDNAMNEMENKYDEFLLSLWNNYIKCCRQHPEEYDPSLKPSRLPAGAEEYNLAD